MSYFKKPDIMSSERRGGRSALPAYAIESKLLKQFPSWGEWKPHLINRLENSGIDANFSEDEESLLHEWYLVRRKVDLRLLGYDAIAEMDIKLEEGCMYKNENTRMAITYITNKSGPDNSRFFKGRFSKQVRKTF